MNTIILKMQQVMKQLLLVGVISASCLSIGFAQSTTPPTAPQPVQQPPNNPGSPAGYPGGTPVAVVDATASSYLPTYLPYFANMLYTLTDEVQWFYTEAQDDITGSGPFDESNVSATNNTFQLVGIPAAITAEQTATSSGITNALGMTGPNIGGTMAAGIAIPGTDITGDPTTDNSAFNFDSLFGPLGYSSTQLQSAQNSILFLTGGTIPLVVPTLSPHANIRANQLLLPGVQTYFLKLRTYTSEASVGLSNLNYLLNERTVQKSLGSQAGMTTLPTNNTAPQPISDASPLQVQQWMVQRRLNNPTWYTNINKAREIDVEREMLFVLTEIEGQLYQLHLDNERMMATASVGTFALGAAGKTALAPQAAQVATDISNNGGTN